jgi:hypothetical protein
MDLRRRKFTSLERRMRRPESLVCDVVLNASVGVQGLTDIARILLILQLSHDALVSNEILTKR